MPISRCALTATVRRSVPRCPARLHPCFQPHFAPTHGAHATLHAYHPGRENVNAQSGRAEVRLGWRSRIMTKLVRAVRGNPAECFDRNSGQLTDMRLAFVVLDLQAGGSAIA
jgi:hypothetical protein